MICSPGVRWRCHHRVGLEISEPTAARLPGRHFGLLGIQEFATQPRARHRPIPFGGGQRDAERCSDLFRRQFGGTANRQGLQQRLPYSECDRSAADARAGATHMGKSSASLVPATNSRPTETVTP